MKEQSGEFSAYFVLTVGINLSLPQMFKPPPQSHTELFFLSRLLKTRTIADFSASTDGKEIEEPSI